MCSRLDPRHWGAVPTSSEVRSHFLLVLSLDARGEAFHLRSTLYQNSPPDLLSIFPCSVEEGIDLTINYFCPFHCRGNPSAPGASRPHPRHEHFCVSLREQGVLSFICLGMLLGPMQHGRAKPACLPWRQSSAAPQNIAERAASQRIVAAVPIREPRGHVWLQMGYYILRQPKIGQRPT